MLSPSSKDMCALNLFEQEVANMARGKQSTGQCMYCGQVISKGGHAQASIRLSTTASYSSKGTS